MNADGGADADRFLNAHPLVRDVDPVPIDALLLAIATNYWRIGRMPHHHVVANAILRWLDERVPG